MNERIKEFAQQANAWYPDGYPSAEGGDEAWQNLVIFEKEDLEKFAELIIRECVSVADKAAGLDAEYEAWYLIKEHFGVE